jgi:hypothetical protein
MSTYMICFLAFVAMYMAIAGEPKQPAKLDDKEKKDAEG